MRNKKGIIILIAVMFIQLLIPVGMIAYRNNEKDTALETGEKYLFRIEYLYYMDGCITFDIKNAYKIDTRYAAVEKGEDGYAVITASKSRPKGENYIRSSVDTDFSFPEYIINTETYENLDFVQFTNGTVSVNYETYLNSYENIYLEAYVYKGEVSVNEIYIDGEKIEDVLEELNNLQK